MDSIEASEIAAGAAVVIIVIFVAIIVFGSLAWGVSAVYRPYQIWSYGMQGRAELALAENNRKIKIEEAKANLESEKLNAQAEVERAKGVAEANEIIAGGLKGNEEYLRYLWIRAIGDSTNGNKIIYIPTEANLPILEASRLK